MSWCTGDCVWMGPELDRLRERNSFLEKLLEKAVKDKNDTLEENDKLREELDQLKEVNDGRSEKTV